jgi:predicted N-acetyltransferase YhbS
MPVLREIVLHPIRAEHSEPAAALIRLAFGSQGTVTDPPPSALLESGASVASHLAAPGQGGFAAWIGQAMVGCVMWQVQPRGLYLGRLAVHPEHRGRGIAPALVAAVEAQGSRLGQPRVLLSTRLVLADNRRLFARCGFVETAQHAHPGYAHPTFVDMEKPTA